MRASLDGWKALRPEEVSAVLEGLDRRWWIAGGWAIALHLGRVTRPHGDVDVLLLRDDLPSVQQHLAAWDLHAADPPGALRPWPHGQTLPAGVHDVWCRRSSDLPWCLQLMVDDVVDGAWVCRRDPRVRRPVRELDGPTSNAMRRVLAPEVQLLYKSESPREKDEADFRLVRGVLRDHERNWLKESLAVASPAHPWLALL